MDLIQFKTRFESAIQPNSTPIGVEAIWEIFKNAFQEILDEESCEEFGFSAGLVACPDERLFQIYFGRLIDARPGCSWRTVEINYYFRFEIDAQLQLVLEQLQGCALEDAYCQREGDEAIRQKLAVFTAFVDGKQNLWAAVRGRIPVMQDIQFLVH